MKIRSSRHLSFVRQQPCLISSLVGDFIVAHHLLRAGGKGMGTKACDSLVVPLTSFMHDSLHRNGNEVAFFAKYGIDYEAVKQAARAFALESPDKKIREAVSG